MKQIDYIQYPNPSFVREEMLLLDGDWEYYSERKNGIIKVPFCPESVLSGIEDTGFIPTCRYKRKIKLPQYHQERVILHFGAVDYLARVYLNGHFCGQHKGGYTPFAFDITNFLQEDNILEVQVEDFTAENTPTGKQSHREKSYGCFYTRTTGIWQSVWLEFVPKQRIKDFYFYPNIGKNCVNVDLSTLGAGNYSIEVFYDGEKVGESIGQIAYRKSIEIALSQRHLWESKQGRLYDVKMSFEKDTVYSYFGLRSVRFDGYRFLLNEESVFQRLVLDQGYYQEGVYTPKNYTRFEKDIDFALSLGFNGIRLHQKLFDPKYLYYADKKGVMVWGEFPSWGIDYSNLDVCGVFLQEWQECIHRDFNHPSIVIWCPLNEIWGDIEIPEKCCDVRFCDAVYMFTKTLDTTRPCVDVSGGYHGAKTDLYDFHCYQTAEELRTHLEKFNIEDVLDIPLLFSAEQGRRYEKGEPAQISEFGGIAFRANVDISTGTVNEGAVQSETDWGYGNGEEDEDAFIARYEKLIETIKICPKLSGFCYTQLYDIEQEKNGFAFYNREPKLSQNGIRKIHQINMQQQPIEEK